MKFFRGMRVLLFPLQKGIILKKIKIIKLKFGKG